MDVQLLNAAQSITVMVIMIKLTRVYRDRISRYIIPNSSTSSDSDVCVTYTHTSCRAFGGHRQLLRQVDGPPARDVRFKSRFELTMC